MIVNNLVHKHFCAVFIHACVSFGTITKKVRSCYGLFCDLPVVNFSFKNRWIRYA